MIFALLALRLFLRIYVSLYPPSVGSLPCPWLCFTSASFQKIPLTRRKYIDADAVSVPNQPRFVQSLYRQFFFFLLLGAFTRIFWSATLIIDL